MLISPEELRIPSYIREDVLAANNIPFTEVERLEDAMPDLDVLYMTRVQKERFFNEEDYVRLKNFYILTKSEDGARQRRICWCSTRFRESTRSPSRSTTTSSRLLQAGTVRRLCPHGADLNTLRHQGRLTWQKGQIHVKYQWNPRGFCIRPYQSRHDPADLPRSEARRA